MSTNAVIWFEIYVQDMARAKTFYESVFGMKLERIDAPGPEMWSFPMQLNQVGCGGMLVKMDEVRPGCNSTVVYFASDDCTKEERRAAQHGGKVVKAKTSIGQYGFMSLLHDTEGNLIGLHSMK
jgi:uncharacterized protein